MINQKTCSFEMGTSNLTKVPLFVRNISPPDVSDYQPFSVIKEVDEGSAIRHGFQSATLTWVNPDSRTIYNIKQLVDDALNNDRLLYLTIPQNDGSVIAKTFNEYVGVVHPIDATEQGAMFGRGVVYNSLTLFVNNLVIDDGGK